jgi:preprotein translocase subunit SecE
MATKQKKQDKAAAGAAVLAAERAPSKFQALGRYFEDARTELGKVSWPTQKEIKITSIAVLVLVVVMSLFLGIADLLLAKIMEFILSIGL